MRRREAITAICALCTPFARAQTTRQVARVGVLTMGVPATSRAGEALRQGLREHGYIDGKTLSLHYRFANGDPKQMPKLAAELVQLGVDIVVTESFQAALAMKEASAKMPIVTAVIADPVKLGLAATYSQPGGNITGLTVAGANRIAKQLQILKELLPELGSVAVLHNSSHPDAPDNAREARRGTEALGIKAQLIEIRSPADFDAGFAAVAKLSPEGLVVIGDGMLFNHHKRIVEFAVKHRLPGAFPEREYAAAGGLLAYGPSIPANFRRAAAFVDKILKGATPGLLPIEQPSQFDLVLNLVTAKSLRLKIPPAILVRADEVLQ